MPARTRSLSTPPTDPGHEAGPRLVAAYRQDEALVDHLRGIVDLLPHKEREVATWIFGLNGPAKEGAWIAEGMKFTRSRIYQIRDSAMLRLDRATSCFSAVEAIVRAQAELVPLPLHEMTSLPWARGMDEAVAKYLIALYGGVHEVDMGWIGKWVVPFRQAHWGALGGLLSEAIRLSGIGADPATVAAAFEASVPAAELTGRSLGKVAALAFRHCDVLGAKVRSGHLPEAMDEIFDGCDTALGIRDVARRLAGSMQEAPSYSNVESYLDDHAWAVGGELYIRRSGHDTDPRSAAAAAAVVEAGPPGRKWPTYEILLTMQEASRGGRWKGLNPYGLERELAAHRTLERVSPMIWRSRAAPAAPPHSRDEVAIGILERHAVPLRTGALMALFAAETGIASPAILVARGRIVEVSQGLWGLSDRDLGVPATEMDRLAGVARTAFSEGVDTLDAMRARFRREGAPADPDDRIMLSAMNTGAALRVDDDGRIRVAGRRPNRKPSMSHLALRILSEAPEGLTPDELVDALTATGAKVSIALVRIVLRKRAVRGTEGRWVLPPQDVPGDQIGALYPISRRNGDASPRPKAKQDYPKVRKAVVSRNAQFDWTRDREGILLTLWNSGSPIEEIRAALGDIPSKSAVIGKIHRMGLKR